MIIKNVMLLIKYLVKKKSKTELVYDCIFISNFLNMETQPWISTGKKMSDDDIIDYHCTNFINLLAKTKGKKTQRNITIFEY